MARRTIDQRCSFCGKTRDQVRRLVAGPGVFICDDCVRLCNDVINDPPSVTPTAAGTRTWVKKTSRPRGWFWRLFRIAVLQPTL